MAFGISMGNLRTRPRLSAVYATLLILSIFKVNGQINTACTSSMISSFTPCVNYITGSSANGRSSPTANCCNSLKSLMSDSVDCACLIITGNVPLSLPFVNRTLAISLPRVCNSGVPMQCKASGTPLPAPGPAALFAPTQAPIASSPKLSPRASKASAVASPPTPIETSTPASSPSPVASLAPVAHPGVRPVLTPRPDSSASCVSSPSLLLVTFLGAVVLKLY